MLESGTGQALQFDGEDPEFIERVVLEGADRNLRLSQVRLFEAIAVDDQDAIRWL